MTEFKIEKDVPVVRASKYPFPKMDVGDSFLVPNTTTYARDGKTAIAAASRFGLKHGWKFVCRTVDGGVRIWRAE